MIRALGSPGHCLFLNFGKKWCNSLQNSQIVKKSHSTLLEAKDYALNFLGNANDLQLKGDKTFSENHHGQAVCSTAVV